jgi:hypothetical protein
VNSAERKADEGGGESHARDRKQNGIGFRVLRSFGMGMAFKVYRYHTTYSWFSQYYQAPASFLNDSFHSLGWCTGGCLPCLPRLVTKVG